jgi:hypothetical protein
MLGSLKVSRLLGGADLPAVQETCLRFQALVQALGPRLLEAEINPLLVLPAGQGVRAADGLVVLA